MRKRRIAKFPVLLLVTGCLASGIALEAVAQQEPDSSGRETSTKVLNDLVERVDKSITTLEKSSADRLEKIKSFEHVIGSAEKEYKEASTPLEKHDAKSKLIDSMSKKNFEARTQVAETVNTISSVVGNLEILERELKNGNFTPEALHERRMRLAHSLNNLGPIIAELENLADDDKRSQFAAAKKTLLLYYQQLQDKPMMNAGVFQSLGRTRETLDNVIVQLNVVHELLNQQRYVLEISAHRAIVELAIIRLQNATFNGDKVRSLASSIIRNVLSDDDAMKIIGESSMEDDEEAEAVESVDWETIANGDVEL